MKEYKNESAMYPDIIASISQKLSFLGYTYTVYETWHTFEPELKTLFPKVCSILNKDVLPDILVVYENESKERKCLVIEVKIKSLTVKDIAQAKIYTDVFDADSALLVSPVKIRKSFVEFSKHNENFLKCTNGAQLYTCVLENGHLQLQSCYPNDGRIFK